MSSYRSLAILFCATLFAVSLQAQAPSYRISPVGGTGVAGFAGDGAAATDAQFNFPYATAVGPNGTLYVADAFNRRIRAIAANGTVSTVSGNGNLGIAGDGGPATSAQMGSAYGIAVDSAGNFYFSDPLNSIIRKVTASGTISRFAGTGARSFGGDGGDAVAAQINLPTGLAADSAGNVYFADTLNHRIRRVGTDGKINTVAGNGVPSFRGDGGPATDASLNRPEAVAVDSAGNLYIADTYNHRIRKVAVDGTITTIAGNGNNAYGGDGLQGPLASLNYPKGVAVSASGEVFVADTFNFRIRMVTEDGRIWTIAGNILVGDYTPEDLDATAAIFRFPAGVHAGPGGVVYVSDTDNSRIKKLMPAPGPPVIFSGGVISSAGFGGSPRVAQGSWVEIHGRNLAESSQIWTAVDFVNGDAPTVLGDTSVTVGGLPTVVSYVSPEQVNVLIPGSVPTGKHKLVVTTPLGSSKAYPIVVEAIEPGMLAPPQFAVQDKQYVAAFTSDYSAVILPEGIVQGVTTRPAKVGDVIVLYGIGFGPVMPGVEASEAPLSPVPVSQPIDIRIGGVSAVIAYAGPAAGSMGLYQFSIVVPPVAPGDSVPVTIRAGKKQVPQTLFTAIGN